MSYSGICKSGISGCIEVKMLGSMQSQLRALTISLVIPHLTGVKLRDAFIWSPAVKSLHG